MMLNPLKSLMIHGKDLPFQHEDLLKREDSHPFNTIIPIIHHQDGIHRIKGNITLILRQQRAVI